MTPKRVLNTVADLTALREFVDPAAAAKTVRRIERRTPTLTEADWSEIKRLTAPEVP